MTDINQTNGASELEPGDREIFMFARRLGIAGAILLLVGVTGIIATADQTSWDSLRLFYLALIVVGPCGIMIYPDSRIKQPENFLAKLFWIDSTLAAWHRANHFH